MSHLMNAPDKRNGHRRQLLTSVSVLALLTAVYGSSEALAASGDTDRPLLWIELGGQLERAGTTEQAFAPPFIATFPSSFTSPIGLENRPFYSYGAESKISFEPEGSDWIFSASIRYGRASSARHLHQQSKVTTKFQGFHQYKYAYGLPRFADTQTEHGESHTILDFQAGKDFGLGLFGKGNTATLGFGVRYAQLNTKSASSIDADPDSQYDPVYIGYYFHKSLPFINLHHLDAGSAQAARSFRGVGPSLSLDSSIPFAGSPDTSQLTLDWGVNAAILFGRQKAKIQHRTSGRYYYYNAKYHHRNKHSLTYNPSEYLHAANPPARMRSVSVPNVGGFAGISVRFPNAKVSIGYRADIFFDAMDGGWDTAKIENRSFMGPFASISIGLGSSGN